MRCTNNYIAYENIGLHGLPLVMKEQLMIYYVINKSKPSHLMYDPDMFCIIRLYQGHLLKGI